MRLSEVVRGNKTCHHLWKVNSIVYDKSCKVYHFDCKCELCGLFRRAMDFTEDSLEWNLNNISIFPSFEVHEIHTFARPEDVSNVRFGD